MLFCFHPLGKNWKASWCQVLVRLWSNRCSCTLLVECKFAQLLWPSFVKFEGVRTPQSCHATSWYMLQGTDFQTGGSTDGCRIDRVSHDHNLKQWNRQQTIKNYKECFWKCPKSTVCLCCTGSQCKMHFW